MYKVGETLKSQYLRRGLLYLAKNLVRSLIKSQANTANVQGQRSKVQVTGSKVKLTANVTHQGETL